ncbi:MAG: XdhC family protein [Waterburya sp.]
MKELQNIIATWKQLQNKQQTAALATLVKVEGSAYRCPGARMLITVDGQQIGAISGGCLESDVIERSQDVIKTGIPNLVKYDTTSEDDLIWGLGLGCQGVAYILIEKLNTDELNALSVIDQCLSQRQVSAVATIFQVENTEKVKIGDYPKGTLRERILVFPDQRIVSQVQDSELNEIITQDLLSVLQQQQSLSQTYVLSEGMIEVFLEVIEPPLSLVIFGAGFDVIPVVHFAKQLGWYVTVVDLKARSMTKERFFECDRVILGFSEEIESQIAFDDRTVGVIMTHNYLDDLELLSILHLKSLAYLGILGARVRTQKLISDLQQQKAIFEIEQLDNLYTPVGLDIGANNPEEIALSIIAEIQAVTQNRKGGFLKNRITPIHSRTQTNSLNSFSSPALK